MSSYRAKGKEKATSREPYYPTQWSNWEWKEERNCYSRYRLSAPGQYEFEDYQAEAPVQATTPRYVPQVPFPSSAPLSAYPATSNVSYATTSVDSITQNLAASSLDTETRTGNGPVIRTSNPTTKEEAFDPNYRVHAEKEFKFGKVFKLLWAEPAGNTSSGHATEGDESIRYVGKYKQAHFEKVRRFVVISPRRGHCLCLPINTYNNQGTTKRGVHAEDHAIIYTDKPAQFPGEREKGMTKSPIRVVPASKRHKLDIASRLNYAKVYTVECNVKVWFIGKVHEDSEDKMVVDYNATNPPLGAPTSNASPYLPSAANETYSYTTGGSNYPPGGSGASGSSNYPSSSGGPSY